MVGVGGSSPLAPTISSISRPRPIFSGSSVTFRCPSPTTHAEPVCGIERRMTTELASFTLRIMDDDVAVIKRVMEGDVDAFEVLLRKYDRQVFSLVGRKVPAEDVEMVAQDVFLSAFRSLGTYEAIQPFEHWLARIVRRRCCDYWRERERRNKVDTVSMDVPDRSSTDHVLSGLAHESGHQEDVRKDQSERVYRVLGELNAEDRALIEGMYFEDVALKDMSAVLGWSLVKTKVRAHRARKKLRVLLDKMFGNEVKR